MVEDNRTRRINRAKWFRAREKPRPRNIKRAREWREMVARKEVRAPKKPIPGNQSRAIEWSEMIFGSSEKEMKAPKKPKPRNQNRARKWREAKEKVMEEMKKELARLQKENAELK